MTPPTLQHRESRRILCIRLLNWPIDRLCRRRSALRLNPLALIDTACTNRRLVAASCPKARALGVRPGITEAEAKAVCPSLVCLPHDPIPDARGLRSLGRWMMRFTPVVAVANGPDDPLGTPDALLLDVTGCERVFRGLHSLIRNVAESVERFQLVARIALGPSPGAAWAMTFAETKPRVTTRLSSSKSEVTRPREALSDLPCESLRLDPDTAAKLYHLGVHTIGQLLKIPRDQLPARFGKLLTQRIDQLLGDAPEPLVPLDAPGAIAARMDFDGVVTSLEVIWIVFRELLGRVITQLERRGRGARELDIKFIRAYAPPILKMIRLSRPSRDPVNLFNLFRCATEQLEDAGNSSDEFLGLRLLVRVHEPLPDAQIDLLDGESYAGETELDHLIERLCARLGERSIAQPEPIEAHVPERAYRSTPARDRRQGRFSDAVLLPNPKLDLRERHLPTNLRPLCLLPHPLEVRVTLNPFGDAFGRPMQFVATHDGHVHRLMQVVGPERIGGQWWDGRHKTRDYFDVEDESGGRFWLFRVNETRRWFLHGEFG